MVSNLRLSVFLFFTGFIIFIGLPIWWQTTLVYRANLPIQEITQLYHQNTRESWPITLNIYIFSPQIFDPAKISSKTSNSHREQYFTIESKPFFLKKEILPPQILEGGNEEIDNFFFEWVGENKEGNYSFFVILGEPVDSDEFVFGKYRHAWVKTRATEEDYLIDNIIPSIFSSTYATLSHSSNFLQNFDNTPKKISNTKKDSMIRVKLSSGYHLSFSLCNGNPKLISGWDFMGITEHYLNPLLKQLSSIADISIDSQVVNYAELEKDPQFDSETKRFFFSKDVLPYIINSNSWNLDFVFDTKPSLNFVMYIPNPKFSPLFIKKTTKNRKISTNQKDNPYSEYNGWIIPQWGGVVIFNPENLTETLGEKRGRILSEEEILPTLQVFVSQIRELFGIPESSKRMTEIQMNLPEKSRNTKIHLLENPTGGITSWEIDSVLFGNLNQFQLNAKVTLLHFIELIEQFPIIPIKDQIAENLKNILSDLERSYNHSKKKDYISGLHFSKKAYELAENTFFDPKMIAILYFPSEHKYAIYLPLFLPLTFPILEGLWKELKKKREKERAKKANRVPKGKPTFLWEKDVNLKEQSK